MKPIEQEPDRVPRRLVRVSAIAIAIGILASVGATLLLGRSQLGELVRVESRPPRPIDTQPFQIETEWEREARAAEERLRSFGWVDRARGIVHVPLEIAIELYLQEAR